MNGGREIVKAIDDEEDQKSASSRIVLFINNQPNEQVLDELLKINSSEIEDGNQVSVTGRIFGNDGFQVEEREKEPLVLKSLILLLTYQKESSL